LELGWKDNGIVTLLGADNDVAAQAYQAGMSGAALELSGGSHMELITGLTINQGANVITRLSGSSASLVVGSISRPTAGGVTEQGTLNLGSGGYLYTTNANVGASTNAIQPGYATVAGAGWAQRQDNVIVGTVAGVASTAATDRITIANMVNGQIIRFSASPMGQGMSISTTLPQERQIR
jgi:hypothetical protein